MQNLKLKEGDRVVKEMVQYADYDKIADVVMYINSTHVLKFYTELYRKTKRGRFPFHTEIGYDLGDGLRVNINREFHYYLAIESILRDDNGDKTQIRIYLQDIYFLSVKLNQVLSWFTDSRFNKLFVKRDGRIIMTEHPDSIVINLSFDKYIEFEPGIIVKSGEEITGVKVYLSSDKAGFFLSTDELFSFYYCIANFNMYQSAQLMLAYIGPPEPGVNYHGMNSISQGQKFINQSPLNLNFNNNKESGDLFNSGMKVNNNIKKPTSFLEKTATKDKNDNK